MPFVAAVNLRLLFNHGEDVCSGRLLCTLKPGSAVPGPGTAFALCLFTRSVRLLQTAVSDFPGRSSGNHGFAGEPQGSG